MRGWKCPPRPFPKGFSPDNSSVDIDLIRDTDDSFRKLYPKFSSSRHFGNCHHCFDSGRLWNLGLFNFSEGNMNTDEPQLPEGFGDCRYCGKTKLSNSNWCPHCGAGSGNFGEEPKRVKKRPYEPVLIVLVFLMVPFGCCGTCIPERSIAIGSIIFSIVALIVGCMMIVKNAVDSK